MHQQLRKLLEGAFVGTTGKQPTPDAPVTNLAVVAAAKATFLMKENMPELALNFLNKGKDQKKTERLKGLLGLVYMNKYLRDNPQTEVYGPVPENFFDHNIVELQHKIEKLKLVGVNLDKVSVPYLLGLICLYDGFKHNLNADKFPQEVSFYTTEIKNLTTRMQTLEAANEQPYYGA